MVSSVVNVYRGNCINSYLMCLTDRQTDRHTDTHTAHAHTHLRSNDEHSSFWWKVSNGLCKMGPINIGDKVSSWSSSTVWLQCLSNHQWTLLYKSHVIISAITIHAILYMWKILRQNFDIFLLILLSDYQGSTNIWTNLFYHYFANTVNGERFAGLNIRGFWEYRESFLVNF